MTIHVAIGNSDDRLPQREWSQYWEEVESWVDSVAITKYGAWLSAPMSRYQNACWAFDLHHFVDPEMARSRLSVIAKQYGQESVSWNESVTRFVAPEEEAW